MPFLFLSGCAQLLLGDQAALYHPVAEKTQLAMNGSMQSGDLIDQGFSHVDKEIQENKIMPENFHQSTMQQALFTMPRIQRNQLSHLEVVLMDGSIGNYRESKKDLMGHAKAIQVSRKNSLFSGNQQSTQEVVVPAAHPWSALGLQPLE